MLLLKGKHIRYYDVEVSPKDALLKLEQLLLIQAGIQNAFEFYGYYPIYINKKGQIVQNCMNTEPRVLVDKPTQRQLELLQAFETLKRELQ